MHLLNHVYAFEDTKYNFLKIDIPEVIILLLRYPLYQFSCSIYIKFIYLLAY